MALNKAVVKSIHRFLDQPDPKTLHGMVTTGSIFRYLEYQEQLGVAACNQLLGHLSDHLQTLDNNTLLKLYSAVGRGFVGSKTFATLLGKSVGTSFLPPRPSVRTASY